MTESSRPCPPDWEIFCQVVDNYGDIGVCWRLARSLVTDHGLSVRLWVDDWHAFARLCPALTGHAGRVIVDGVELCPWHEPFPAVEPASVVIEAFGCALPALHLEAMANRPVAPVWINLEYLSAESWVTGCHGLASPHPQLPLVRHFFFPGFEAKTGGLLREAGLLAEHDCFRQRGGRETWLAEHGFGAIAADTLIISMFAYEQPALADLISAWAGGERPVVLLVPEGRVLADVARAFACPTLAAGGRLRMGKVELAVLPFTDQAGYDRLLWSCDLNFVRGEDSFVRAQWAARPFVWHIYPQQDDAHFDKLEAFLARYCSGLDAAAASALAGFWRAWNGRGVLPPAWSALLAVLPAIDAHALAWCSRLSAQTDLASNLKQFCNHIIDPRE